MEKNMKLHFKIILYLACMGVVGQAHGMDTPAIDQQLSSDLCQIPADLRPHIIYLADTRAMVKSILALQQTCKCWREILNTAGKKTLVSKWFFEGKEFDEQEELVQSLRNMFFYPFKVYTPELYIMIGADVRDKAKLGHLPLESLIGTQTNESFAQPLKLLIRAGLTIDTQMFEKKPHFITPPIKEIYPLFKPYYHMALTRIFRINMVIHHCIMPVGIAIYR